MRAFVLTYHSGNVAGNDYATNNLVALGQDLHELRAQGVPLVPLREIVNALLAGQGDRLPERVAALTLDDGLDFDFVDLVHPHHGPQASVRAVLERHERVTGDAVHATSFVIASPEARRQIADREMLGHQWIGDHWWAAAVASGRFDIGNHGWDHVSPSVTPVAERDGRSGSFRHVETFAEADRQVRVAREFIAARAPNPGTAFFAYPYGDPSDYAANDYLPRHGEQHGTMAAFTGRPEPIHAQSNRWRLPRYTCGMDWHSTSELARIVRD
jgi:peptidoglycan/xylan/chitin deacetylase (PgdA/CDA1 family)